MLLGNRSIVSCCFNLPLLDVSTPCYTAYNKVVSISFLNKCWHIFIYIIRTAAICRFRSCKLVGKGWENTLYLTFPCVKSRTLLDQKTNSYQHLSHAGGCCVANPALHNIVLKPECGAAFHPLKIGVVKVFVYRVLLKIV